MLGYTRVVPLVSLKVNIFLIIAGLFIVVQSYGSDKSKIIVAQKGDGVYTLLRKAGLPPSKYMSEFKELNKKKLGPNDQVIAGFTYKLPGTKEPETAPLEKKTVGKRSHLRSTADREEGTSELKSSKRKESVISKHKNRDDDQLSSDSEQHGRKGKKHVKKDIEAEDRSEHSIEQERIKDGVIPIKGEDVKVKDHSLRNAIFYLGSGHGGPDPGCVSFVNGNMLCEDEYAYDIIIRLYQNLREKGARVYMIVRDPDDGVRETEVLKQDNDELCYPNDPIPLSQSARLKQRINVVNRLAARHKDYAYQRLVSIHVDSRSESDNVDVFFYYDQNKKAGHCFADNLQKTISRKYDQYQPGRGYNGTVSSRNLYVIKFSNVPGVLIEVGNINHERDRVRLMKPENRQAIANWLTEGIVRDYEKSGAATR